MCNNVEVITVTDEIDYELENIENILLQKSVGITEYFEGIE